MAKQTISVGSAPNDGTGSTIRDGGILINDNFNEIYAALGDGTNLVTGTITGKQEGANTSSAVTALQEHVGGTGAASGSGEVNPPPKPDSLGLTTNKPWESANANTAPGTPAAASGTAPSTKPANTGVKTNKPEGLDLTTKAP